MKRRSFLKTAGAGAAAAPFIVPSRLIGADAPGGDINIGCIGTGRMGRNDMKQTMHQCFDLGARIVAVCDVDKKRCADAANDVKKFYNEKLGVNNWKCDEYGDFRELLARKDVDAVNIVLPDHWHAIPAIAAANAGKDMYLEKPLTYTIYEGQQLVKAVRKNNVILQTGSMQRSSIYFRKVCELVRNGAIGKLNLVEVHLRSDHGEGNPEKMPVPENLNYDMWLGPTPEVYYTEDRVHPQNKYRRPGWLQIEQYCRGMITGWGAHMYDIAQWGLGTDTDSGPVRIKAKGEFPKRGLFDVHTDYEAEAYYADGLKMISGTKLGGRAGVKFIGEDGWLYVTRGRFEASDPAILKQKTPDNGIHLYESKQHMVNFLECVKSRKEPITPVEVGHRSNSVCVLHHISMKLGREVLWDPKKEEFPGDSEANAMLSYEMRAPWKV